MVPQQRNRLSRAASLPGDRPSPLIRFAKSQHRDAAQKADGREDHPHFLGTMLRFAVPVDQDSSQSAGK
jgi:hypothetical protein